MLRDLSLWAGVIAIVAGVIGFVIPNTLNKKYNVKFILYASSFFLFILNIIIWRATGLDAIQYASCTFDSSPAVCEAVREKISPLALADTSSASSPSLAAEDTERSSEPKAKSQKEDASQKEGGIEPQPITANEQYGIPSYGNGATLAAYHVQANSQSVIRRRLDKTLFKQYFEFNDWIPIFRQYCRIDPRDGVLLATFIPYGDRIQIIEQGSENSFLGRTQIYEPALQDFDPNAPRLSYARPTKCKSNSCTLNTYEGETYSIKWSESPTEILLEKSGQSTNRWNDCRCRYTGSFVTCDGVDQNSRELL